MLAGDSLEVAFLPVFKSCTMRLQFIALDRPDLQFVSKELARAMASPTQNAWEHLKHVARYLLGKRSVKWWFRR